MTAPTNAEIDVIVRFCELHADATSSVGDALLMRKAADMLRTLRDQREADAVTPDDLLRSLDKWATENTKEREILAYRDGWTNCRNAHIARAAMSAQGEKS